MKSTFVIALLVAGLTATVSAQTPKTPPTQWQKNHPRRVEVNQRLKNQNKRINTEVKEGDLTKTQAANLKAKDNQIRTEEKTMSSQNGGHITKQEQKVLNQQENKVSKQIGK